MSRDFIDKLMEDIEPSPTDKFREALKAASDRRNLIDSAFRAGTKASAKLARESGQTELADRIDKLKLVRKAVTT